MVLGRGPFFSPLCSALVVSNLPFLPYLPPPFVAVYGPRVKRGVPSDVDNPRSVEIPRSGHGLSICTPETDCASRAASVA
jgi:hypothetical protein